MTNDELWRLKSLIGKWQIKLKEYHECSTCGNQVEISEIEEVVKEMEKELE
ncbi:MAG TPA: hypothetical protein VEP90_10440 [Methylomirabilota bacterium]|nr:hypothetical protein [Methylomirabilota bacterium]